MTQKKSLAILYLIVFIDMLGFGVIIPFLPYLVAQHGASGLFATSLLSIFSLMQFIFSPILGRLSDKYGRRPLLLVGLIGSILSYGLYALAFFITKNTATLLSLIFISRLLAGVMGANIPITMAYISDVTSDTERTAAMGKIGAAFGLGFIFGPAIAAFLAPLGASAPGWAAMLICLCGLIGAYFYLPEPEIHEAKPPQEKLHWKMLTQILLHPWIGSLILIGFIYGFAFTQMESIFSLYAYARFHLTQTQIAWTFVYIGVLIAFSQGFLVGKLSKHLGNQILLLFGAIALSIAFLLLSWTHQLPLMLFLMTFLAFGAAMMTPPLSSMISQHADKNKQGFTQGVNQGAASLARILGPLLSGFLFDHFSPGAPFLLGGLLLCIVTLIIVSLLRRI